jgi:MFS family permease
VQKYGVKIVILSGVTAAAVCCTCFGLLEYIDDPTFFVVASFILRTVNGLAFTAYITGASSTITSLFQPQMGLLMVGPLILSCKCS